MNTSQNVMKGSQREKKRSHGEQLNYENGPTRLFTPFIKLNRLTRIRNRVILALDDETDLLLIQHSKANKMIRGALSTLWMMCLNEKQPVSCQKGWYSARSSFYFVTDLQVHVKIISYFEKKKVFIQFLNLES